MATATEEMAAGKIEQPGVYRFKDLKSIRFTGCGEFVLAAILFL